MMEHPELAGLLCATLFFLFSDKIGSCSLIRFTLVSQGNQFPAVTLYGH